MVARVTLALLVLLTLGREQTFPEEREHPVEGLARGVAGLVDEVLGQHGVRDLANSVRVPG